LALCLSFSYLTPDTAVDLTPAFSALPPRIWTRSATSRSLFS